MATRQDLNNVEPTIYQSIIGIENAVRTGGLDSALIELIRICASPIHRCAFYAGMNTNDVRHTSEMEQRLCALSVWHDQIAQLLMAIISINAWIRIAITTRRVPGNDYVEAA